MDEKISQLEKILSDISKIKYESNDSIERMQSITFGYKGWKQECNDIIFSLEQIYNSLPIEIQNTYLNEQESFFEKYKSLLSQSSKRNISKKSHESIFVEIQQGLKYDSTDF